VLLLLLADLLRDRERIDVHRDRVIEQPQIGETLDDARIRRPRPAGENDERMIVAIEEEAEIRLAIPFAVPAVLVNGQLRSEAIRGIVIETVVQRRIQEPFVVPEMIRVRHG
jgi:hypothetical protein